MSSGSTLDVTLEDHQKAFSETAFLLDIFTATIDTIMGGATASVGRIAGREMARKLPICLDNPSLTEAVTLLATRMEAGFAFALTKTAEQHELRFDRCVLREVCARRGITVGDGMCRLFHSYLDGILNELICRPVKSEIVNCGASCLLQLRTQ